MIKIGIIGMGSMGSIHADLICKNPNYELIAVSDKNTERLKFIENKYNVTHLFADYNDLLKIDEIDYVVIATTNETHEEISISSIKSGKNVIVEKPMSINYKSTLRMIEAALKSKKHLFVHHSRRWDNDFLLIKTYIDSQILGNILSIQSKVMICDEGWPSWGAEGMKNPWRVKLSYGGGILLDWGAHLIDQILILNGKDPLTVYGFMQKGVWSKEVEDYFYAALKFDNEILCQIEVSNNSQITLPRWYIIGTNGTLEVKGNNIPVWDEIDIKYKNINGLQEHHSIKLQGISEISKGFYDDLVVYLKGEKEKFTTMYEASKVIKIIDAIRESSISNKVVNL